MRGCLCECACDDMSWGCLCEDVRNTRTTTTKAKVRQGPRETTDFTCEISRK